MDTQTASQMFTYLSGFPMQLFWPVLIFFLPLRKKEKWYLWLPVPVLLLAGSVGLGLLITLNHPFSVATGPLYFALHYCVVFCSYGLGLRLMTGASVKEIAYCLVCAYMAEHMHYCWGCVCAYLLGYPAWWDAWYIQWLLGIIIYPLIWLLFARRICRDGRYPFSVLHSFSLFAAVMAIMFFLSILLRNMELEWLHGVYTLLLCFVLMAGEVHTAGQLRLQAETESRERMEALLRAQYELSRENIDLINRKSHDLRREVAALRTVATPEEQADVIAEIEQAVDIYDRSYRTGCRALDTVLTQEALKCSQDGIHLSVVANGSLLRFIRSVDLYTMMSNVLDNAIEANLRIADPEKRSIHLAVHERRGLIIIQCENPYEGSVTMRDGLPVTIKADKASHGIGTRSVATIAEAYGGVLRIDPREGMYVLRIIFQPPDVNQGKKTTDQDKAA